MDDATGVWLAANYPGLTLEGRAISGVIDIAAAYNDATDRFIIIRDDREYSDPGLILRGRFDIRIEGDFGISSEALPTLYVGDVPALPDRHFNQPDSSACLCSPFEYAGYLEPEFEFKRFLERLVIPFLYGQVFFDLHHRWPWHEYAHGATGILESYYRNDDPINTAACLERLSQEWLSWPSINEALHQVSEVKAIARCFCGSNKKIGVCHPEALKGINRLRSDLRKKESISAKPLPLDWC